MTARRPTGPRGGPGASRRAGGSRRTGSAGRAESGARPGSAARTGRSPRTSAGKSPAGRPATTARPGAARSAANRPAAAPATPAAGPDAPRSREDNPAPTITLRGVGLLIVLLVAFIVLAPTLRHAVEQQEQLRQLNADIEAAHERNAALELELEQWQDPTFVKAQARDRLGYVMPGEQTYRVIDPEVVVGEEAEVEEESGGVPGPMEAPWYVSIWESVGIAGDASSGEDRAVDGVPEGRTG